MAKFYFYIKYSPVVATTTGKNYTYGFVIFLHSKLNAQYAYMLLKK